MELDSSIWEHFQIKLKALGSHLVPAEEKPGILSSSSFEDREVRESHSVTSSLQPQRGWGLEGAKKE